MCSFTNDVLIQVYDDRGLTVASFSAGTVDVADEDLALLRHYAASSFTVVADEAPVAPAVVVAEAAPVAADAAPSVDEPKDA